MSLPIPFDEHIPKLYLKDGKRTALGNKADSHLEAWQKDVLDIETFKDASRCPSGFLEELGYLLSAGIVLGDDERRKREKILEAIEGHKNRGLWIADAKPRIDGIAGGDSQIIKSVGVDDWILVGDGTTPVTHYWATLGVDGIDDDLGLFLIGAMTEVGVAGNIYIDVDNDSLTQAEIDQIVFELTDIVPAYFRVYLGYIDGTGAWVDYTSM